MSMDIIFHLQGATYVNKESQVRFEITYNLKIERVKHIFYKIKLMGMLHGRKF
jgi:hypothetical protein